MPADGGTHSSPSRVYSRYTRVWSKYSKLKLELTCLLHKSTKNEKRGWVQRHWGFGGWQPFAWKILVCFPIMDFRRHYWWFSSPLIPQVSPTNGGLVTTLQRHPTNSCPPGSRLFLAIAARFKYHIRNHRKEIPDDGKKMTHHQLDKIS